MDERERTQLSKFLSFVLRHRPEAKLILVGHTDNTGNMDLNMKLSADRATSVTAELTCKHRIDARLLRALGVGPLAPVATNRTRGRKAKNRRVDLVEP